MRFSGSKLLIVCVLSSTPVFADDAPCPDYRSPACIDYIRAKIDLAAYPLALDAAHQQCHGSSDEVADDLSEQGMLLRVSACHSLTRLQILLGQHERAFASKERTRGLARFGCHSGFHSICEFYVSFLRDQVEGLVAELAYVWRSEDRWQHLRPELHAVAIGREFPQSFEKIIRDAVERSFAKADDRRTETVRLELDLRLVGEDVTLGVTAFAHKSAQPVWQRRLADQELRQRYRFFGENFRREKEPVWSRAADDYKPLYKHMLGLGIASIPNFAGGEADHIRHTVELRSTEIFQSRRAEFGLMVLAHLTRRGVLNIKENEDELPKIKVIKEGKEEEGPEEITIHPYQTATGIYGVFGYQFSEASPSFYQSTRLGVYMAIGGFFNKDFVAPSSKLGVDFYIGRNWVVSLACLVVGQTNTYFGANAFLNETEFGGDLTFSFQL